MGQINTTGTRKRKKCVRKSKYWSFVGEEKIYFLEKGGEKNIPFETSIYRHLYGTLPSTYCQGT
jgi:hypothetical protein